MNKILSFIIIISCISLNLIQIIQAAHDCMKDNEHFSCKLGTKSAYRFIANYNESPLFYAGCKEKKIWMLIRHGTRFPSKKIIKSMLENLPHLQKNMIEQFDAGNSKLSKEIIERLADWKPNFNHDQAKILAEEGENEMIDLAERMQTRFPLLFPENYSNETYSFKHTDTQRTKQSAKFFILGLFGQLWSEQVVLPDPVEDDPILRFYKRCNFWRNNVKKNPETYEERDFFINSDTFQNVLRNLSQRVGFEINYENASDMHAICTYETAWDKVMGSPWCDLFTYEEHKVFEYKQDLQYYADSGYKNPINYEQACPVFVDMFNFFESDNQTTVSAYFSHSGSILKVLSLLGVGKDNVKLDHKSYSENHSRNWRVSLIDTFASNIAFVLYECKSQGKSIVVMHQERPVHIPGCPPHMPCPIPTMKKLYPDNENECNFEEMCFTIKK